MARLQIDHRQHLIEMSERWKAHMADVHSLSLTVAQEREIAARMTPNQLEPDRETMA